MTKLEQEMYQALRNADKEGKYLNQAAAEVAKRYIEKAIKDAYEQNHKCDLDPNECMRAETFVDIWFKENCITSDLRDCECFKGSKCDSIGECEK